MSQFYHFLLGPVQGFVAQARRTRDFWSGSFILSWLSAVAMHSVRVQGGHLIFPDEPAEEAGFRAWLTGRGQGEAPIQGNTPNRFLAAVDADFQPERVVADVQAAWQALAERVWAADLAPTDPSEATRAIWDRQIAGFWDIQWALTPDQGDTAILDRLKNWRSHQAPPEPGIKCMMMDGWQELSGQIAPTKRNPENVASTPLSQFWGAVRRQKRAGLTLDLRDGEHLCAIAFVKRRFARHFHTLQEVPLPGGWHLSGWPVPTHVPSVTYLAAAPWLARAIETADPQDFWRFHDAAVALTRDDSSGPYGSRDTNLRCIEAALDGSGQRGAWKFAALDGNVFFDSLLEREAQEAQEASKQAEATLNALKNLRQRAGLGAPSPFYAVLLMDGDSLGQHMSDPQQQPAISEALAGFTAGVSERVAEHNGFLVYAGGDDVLALLPLEHALPCAADLRRLYREQFEIHAPSVGSTHSGPTLSGAIEFVHVKVPLTRVLGAAHDLLDNLAKDGRGRDALAVRLRKPGGVAAQWALPWAIALEQGDQGLTLTRLADELQAAAPGERDYSSKFFYGIRDRFGLLNPPDCANGTGAAVLSAEQAEGLITAEYLQALQASGVAITRAQAEPFVKQLLQQCRPVVRDAEKDPKEWRRSPCLEADGALLVRFLAQKGVESR